MTAKMMTFRAYDTRTYGLPWGAVCDHTGKPRFRVQQAYYTGSPGTAGDLMAEDPAEGSVWVYGQPGYCGNPSLKGFLYVRDGEFFPVPVGMEFEYLVTAPDLMPTEARQFKLATVFLKELLRAEAMQQVPDVEKILERHRISHQEVRALGITVADGAEEFEEGI